MTAVTYLTLVSLQIALSPFLCFLFLGGNVRNVLTFQNLAVQLSEAVSLLPRLECIFTVNDEICRYPPGLLKGCMEKHFQKGMGYNFTEPHSS